MSGSGPTPMALGPFRFRAHGFGFGDIQRQTDTAWAEIETAGQWNALQWTGPRSDQITINGVLFPHEWGGLGTLEAMRLAATSGVPLMLVNLGGLIFGRYAIQSIEEDGSHHDRVGTPRKKTWSIVLKRMPLRLSVLSAFGVG